MSKVDGRARSRRLTELQQLTEAATGARSLGDIFDQALGCLENAVGCSRSSVLLFDHEERMRFVAWHGLSETYRQAVDGHSPWSASDEDPTPIAIPDVEAASDLQPLLPALRAEKIAGLAFVPLRSAGRLIGKFMLYFDEPYELGDDDLALAQIVAGHVAFAVERRRQEDELRRARDELAREVDDQRRVEEELRQSEREMRKAYRAAQEAERRKDEFLAILGHELRNPLAPIVTALQLMKLKGDSAFERERTIIDRQVQHLMRLVDDLLDVSRITRGKLELKRQPVDLASVVDKAVEVASPMLEQRGHQLEVDVADGIIINADALRLAQVFANLLTNAAKNTDEEGSVRVFGTSDGTTARISVRDDGVGIDPRVAPDLFDMFVQGSQSLGREKGGLGLGLTIVKRLTEMHGGQVRVESAGLGKGSTFVVTLPVEHVSEAPPPALADETGEHAPVAPATRVLVVDDNVDAADLLADALDNAGYVAKTAYDGPEALEVLKDFRAEIAILDIGLPVMDGYELARKIREKSVDVRLVALTGYGQRQDRRQSKEAGFSAHLVKPVVLRDVLAVLAESPP